MTEQELENRITNKIIESFSILKEYDQNSQFLEMTISKNSTDSYYIRALNDATITSNGVFVKMINKNKSDVEPLRLNRFVGEAAFKFKSADITTDDLFCTDAVMYAYDKAVKEMVKAAEEVGDASQIKFIKVVLQTMRATLNAQLFLDGQTQNEK